MGYVSDWDDYAKAMAEAKAYADSIGCTDQPGCESEEHVLTCPTFRKKIRQQRSAMVREAAQQPRWTEVELALTKWQHYLTCRWNHTDYCGFEYDFGHRNDDPIAKGWQDNIDRHVKDAMEWVKKNEEMLRLAVALLDSGALK